MIGSSPEAGPETGRRRAEWLLLASEELSSSLRPWVPGLELWSVTLPASFFDALPDQIGPRELAARLQRLVGEMQPEPGDRARLRIREGVELDIVAHELRARGQYVHLRPKGYRLLRLLASHPGVAFSRQQLLEQVWGEGHTADPRTVDVHVRWLRERIEADPEHPTLLSTVRGLGYRFDPA
jgi:DNA-binding response OmpR family regulator